MKRLRLLLCLALCLGAALFLLPGTARAADSGACGADLTWTLDDDGTLTVSGSGAMSPDPSPLWGGRSGQIRRLVIGDGVTEICARAFSDCKALEEATLPPGLEKVGNYAFSGCVSLASVSLPGGLAELGGSAFENCTALREVSLPESLTALTVGVFRGCTALEKADLPGGLTAIGGGAFQNCAALRAVEIPAAAAAAITSSTV